MNRVYHTLVDNMEYGSALQPRQFRLAGLFCLLLCSATLSAMPEAIPPQQLLIRMAQASHNTNYSGMFTYEQRGALKSFKIFHTVHDGKEYERLIHMDGPRSEVVRRGNPLECKRVGDVLLRGAVIAGAVNRGSLDDLYRLRVQGEDRVANRLVTELHVIPKDRQRYGYILSIDKESSLLLRAMVISADGKQVYERFQFVDIDIGIEVTEAELESVGAESIEASVDSLPCDGSEALAYQQWQVNWLPKGFVLAGLQRGDQGATETLVFTDGMGFFTIFIEPDSGSDMPVGKGRRGATVVAMYNARHKLQNYSVCVVGEIPMEAAAQIAQSVRARKE